jgi:transposase
MAYPLAAMERAMTVRDVILQALAGKVSWIQAAEILGRSPRSIRRLRLKLERYGFDELYDRRRRTPSPKRAPVAEVQRVLALYRERYQGFNVHHFHQIARQEHAVRFCYAFVKKALQGAGLVTKHAPGSASSSPRAAAVLRRSTASGRQSAPVVGAGPGPVVHHARGRRRCHQTTALAGC